MPADAVDAQEPISTSDKSTPKVSRRDFLKISGLAGLGYAGLSVLQPGNQPSTPALAEGSQPAEIDYSTLLNNLRYFQDEPRYNPPLYAAESPDVSMRDVLERNIVSLQAKEAVFRYLLRGHEFPKENPTELEREYLTVICKAAYVDTLVDADIHGRDLFNTRVNDRLVTHIGWLGGQVYKQSDAYWNNKGNITSLREIHESLDALTNLYQIPPADLRRLRSDAMDSLAKFISNGKLATSSELIYLVSTHKQYDTRGEMAWIQLVKAITDRALEHPENGLSAATLLAQTNNPNYTDLFPNLIAETAHSSAWMKADWTKLQPLMNVTGFNQGCDLLVQRSRAYSDYLKPMDSVVLKPDQMVGDTAVYGERTPLKESQLKALFLSTTGKHKLFYEQGEIPSTYLMGKARSEQMDGKTRAFELFVSKSFWDSISEQLRLHNTTPVEWMLLHARELDQMAKRLDPQLGLSVSLKRIVIVDDDTINRSVKRHAAYASGSPHNNYEFIHPVYWPFMIDTISPWSQDVYGRRVFFDPIDLGNYPDVAKRSLTGNIHVARVPIDTGQVHELAHLILGMPDYYRYNTYDKPQLLAGAQTRDVRNEYKEYLIMSPSGVAQLPLGSGDISAYPWTETMRLAWLQKKHPMFFRSSYLPFFLNRTDSGYPWLSDKPLVLSLDAGANNTPIERSTLIPIDPSDDHIIEAEQRGTSSVFPARELNSYMFNFERAKMNYLLTVAYQNGKKHYLPIPQFLLNTLFYSADVTGDSNPTYHITFTKPPVLQSDSPPYDSLQLILSTQEEFTAIKNDGTKEVYAHMYLTHEGKQYYAVWTVPRR